MSFPNTFPTFARELLAARASLTLIDEIGLALRAHRRALGLSQRAYALKRGYARSTFARLEADAGAARLDEVLNALEGTGFGLYLGVVGTPPSPDHDADGASALPLPASVHEVVQPLAGRPSPVPVETWPRPELIARVRGGYRRFPGHRRTHQITSPPVWWWVQEYFRGGTAEPQWYSPMWQ
jgi:transcriptional regulator with XRE-family HTH domain